LESRATLHQHDPKLVLELLDTGGKRRLTDVAGLGRAPEMLLAGERNDEFKLVDLRCAEVRETIGQTYNTTDWLSAPAATSRDVEVPSSYSLRLSR
jgi:hypothetical protein